MKGLFEFAVELTRLQGELLCSRLGLPGADDTKTVTLCPWCAGPYDFEAIDASLIDVSRLQIEDENVCLSCLIAAIENHPHGQYQGGD